MVKLAAITQPGIYLIICDKGHCQTMIFIGDRKSMDAWNEFLVKESDCIQAHKSQRFYAIKRP